VLSRASFVNAIGRKGKVKGGRQFDSELQTPVFLAADNLKPFITSEIEGNSKCAIRADKMLEFGEIDGYATWKAILRTIVTIRSTAPRAGEAIH